MAALHPSRINLKTAEKSRRLAQRSGEQIEKIERVVRLRGRSAVAVGAARAQTVEKTVRSIAAARATLNLAAAATAVMVVVKVHTAEPLSRILLEGRKSLLSRLQITRLKCLPQCAEGRRHLTAGLCTRRVLRRRVLHHGGQRIIGLLR